MPINVAVVGASGFTGLELVKMLIVHPEFELAYIANTTGDIKLSELHPSLAKVYEIDVSKADAKTLAAKAEVAFLALPHKESMGFAKELLALGIKVVDLSADYRLDQETYEIHYCAHEDPANLPGAVYGLPEYYREEIKGSKLVANPGCYPTATLMGLLPFMEHIDTEQPIFVDAKSGVSGAGKKCIHNTHFATINENIFTYNPLKHRHGPEIKEKVQKVSGKSVQVNFVPHLLPVTRGMLVSVYAVLKTPIQDIQAVLNKQYANEAFVRIRKEPVDIKSTAGTNFADIYADSEGKSLFVSVSIDNLLRGASSQAVANANLICGLPEAMGVPTIAYMP